MKKVTFKQRYLLAAVLSAICGGMALSVSAQDNSAGDTAAKSNVEELVVLGSRRSTSRSAMDAAVPVDVISADDLNRQGSTDPIDALKAVIPSFNANREPISDAGTMVRPINLRGLPSNHTLILVDGKRRHRGAVVGEFVSGINKGSQGVDVAPLFGAALKRVEVLRDGAAAQYGSDAIAGVMNFSLQDDPEIKTITAQIGQAYEGDGDSIEVSGALGMPAGDDGFAVVSFQAKQSDPTSRGVQDGDGTGGGAEGLGLAGFPVADPVVVWGAPEVSGDYKLALNFGTELGESSEAYGFALYSTRDIDGSFFYRNPTNRSGVFASGGNVLFADTTGAGGCPEAPLPTDSFAAAQAFIGSAPANCFAFNSWFPGGFTPRFGGSVKDYSVNGGVKGEFSNGMTYDFSATYGSNDVGYEIYQTVNASLGPNSPTEFDLGGQKQTELVLNADFTTLVDVGLASELSVAFGAQFHDEEFTISPGQVESYIPGPFIAQGFSAGSNGFQGFDPKYSGTSERDSLGFYLDVEADITDNLLLGAAIRHEDFSDFGSTTNGKLAARYRVSDEFAFRAAASTGFRAPTLGQSNLARSSTAFDNGQLIESLVIASTDPIAEFFGGGQLDAEEADNLSIGFTASIGELDLTVDYFDIDVSDRVALTTRSISDADRATLVGMGIPEAATISQVQFFVNDFDTNTSGFDVVASYPVAWESGSTTDVTLALNYTDTEVTDSGETVSEGLLKELEESIPSYRATLSLNHQTESVSTVVRFNYYDEALESLFNDTSTQVVTPSMLIVDAEVAWQINDTYNVAIGAKNLFDEYPDEWSLDEFGWTGRTPGFLGAIYPLNHPAGLGGGSYYLRVKAEF
jgi:iron complex outermembrane receptor protein